MRHAPLLALLLTLACAPGDGVALSELDDNDWARLCGELPPGQTASCDVGGSSIEVETDGPESCTVVRESGAVLDGCTATVGDWRACMDDLDADPCRLVADDPGAACTAVSACIAL